MIRFLHIADLHANKDRKDKCLSVLSKLNNYICDNNIPYLLISGDFWDSTIQNTSASGFPEYVKALQNIASVCKVFIITGTPFHEPTGSLDIFESKNITVIKDFSVINVDNKFELIAIPEPRRINYQNKKDTDAAINEHLREFIKSVNTKKLNRIVMYHGEIQGAYYQNKISAKSKTAIPVKLLKELDGNYYACGHIHQPQEVFENCYYAGSCFPKDFGERHDAGFYDVTIDNEQTFINRVSFGFPINEKAECKLEDIDNLLSKDFSNKNLLLKLSIDKAFKKKFNHFELINEIKEKTNAIDVKIDFVYNTQENLRSEEVAKQIDITDKFISYAKTNNVKYRKAVIEKLNSIKETLLIEQFIPSDIYELESLSLRGAIGIKDGTGLDEVFFDFSNYNGIVALIGTCGSGKTTLIENCHPFPCMLTRKGSLKDHFFLKDSHRILTYKNSKGEKLRISMFIDGVAKCIGTKYFVEKEVGDNWVSVKECDGSFTSYQDYVNVKFGTIDMFLRTAFFAKEHIKSVPDLNNATKSEKMNLFSHLIGVDYLKTIQEKAKELIVYENDIIKDLKSSYKNFDEIKGNIDDLNNNIKIKEKELSKCEELLKLDLEELNVYKIEQEKYVKYSSIADFKEKVYKEKKIYIESLYDKVELLTERKDNIEYALENQELFASQLKWYNEHQLKKSEMNKELDCSWNKITELNNSLMNLNKQKNDNDIEIEKINNKLELTNTNIINIEESIPKIIDNCPVCGAELTEEKRLLLQQEVDRSQKKVLTLKEELRELHKQKELFNNKSLESEIKNCSKQIKELQKRVDEIKSDIKEIDAYSNTLDLEEIKECLKYNKDELDSVNSEISSLENEIEMNEQQRKELRTELQNSPADYSNKIYDITDKINSTHSKIGSLQAEIKFSQQQLDNFTTLKNKIDNISVNIKEHESNIKDYEVISKAFSFEGIPTLELDYSAPEISDIANMILKNTHGDRFQISFETQRDTATGKKVDDFIINIFDSDVGRIKQLDTLSSGESVWIKQALSYAFSIVRSRKTGFCFKTRFLDESDGSLDPESRLKYVKMIEVAHELCGASLTLLITHSSELKDVIEQQINMNLLR